MKMDLYFFDTHFNCDKGLGFNPPYNKDGTKDMSYAEKSDAAPA